MLKLRPSVFSVFLWTLAITITLDNSQIVNANDEQIHKLIIHDDVRNVTCLSISLKSAKMNINGDSFTFNLTSENPTPIKENCEAEEGLWLIQVTEQNNLTITDVLAFIFKNNAKNNESYYLEWIFFQKRIFDHNSNNYSTPINQTLTDMDLRLGNEFQYDKEGYRCNNIDFDLGAGVNVELHDFEFLSRRNNDSTVEPKKFSCRAKPGSNLIPILVGSILLGLMVVAFGVYMFFRRRANKSG